MKVRKLLKYNQNDGMTITILDGEEIYTYLSTSPLLEKYMHRKVLGWRNINLGRIPWIEIHLKKEAEHGR